MHFPIKILTLTPYKLLPATNGGQLGIVSFHDHLGRICDDHIIGTESNAPEDKYSFKIHRLFPDKAKRYLPFYHINKIAALARALGINCIICEHPYMSFTAKTLARKLRVPWFIHSHNIEAERFRSLGKKWWPVLGWYEGYAMRKANGVFFVTPEDSAWTVQHYRVKAEQCHVTPYGTILDKKPEGHAVAKEALTQQLQLDGQKPWLYFIGDLGYEPNRQAVAYIVENILPYIVDKNISCEILIAGKNLSEALQQSITATGGKIKYLGFVPDLDDFLKACDIMINPVLTGGGIKTKAVEALGYNKILVSTVSGAAGIMQEVCGQNMLLTPDGDWNAFADAIAAAVQVTPAIPDPFYQNYYWGNVAAKTAGILASAINQPR